MGFVILVEKETKKEIGVHSEHVVLFEQGGESGEVLVVLSNGRVVLTTGSMLDAFKMFAKADRN